MNSQNLLLMQNYIHKMKRVFKIVLIALSLLELALMIRGFVLFDLERQKLRMYLYSYIFLFVASFVTLIVFWICGDNKKYLKTNVVVIYTYAFCLVMWSAVVTCIDCYADGDSGIMVYVMTCIAVGVLTLLNPWVFAGYVVVSGIFIIIMTAVMRGELYSSGFYINFFVFLATSIFINNHNYYLSKREYEATRKLKKWSYTDQLTDVYNRRRLDQHIATYIKEHQRFVFVLLDIDDFKQVNDTYGHIEGDRCIVTLAKMLTEHFGSHVYRFGGDEFAIISTTDVANTCACLDNVNKNLGAVIGNMTLHISAGVYDVAGDDSSSEIFTKADQALYEAKRIDKGRWVLYGENK